MVLLFFIVLKPLHLVISIFLFSGMPDLQRISQVTEKKQKQGRKIYNS